MTLLNDGCAPAISRPIEHVGPPVTRVERLGHVVAVRRRVRGLHMIRTTRVVFEEGVQTKDGRAASRLHAVAEPLYETCQLDDGPAAVFWAGLEGVVRDRL